jgi:hypothetical protein
MKGMSIPLFPLLAPDAYFILALVSRTAARKNNPLRGILSPRIIAVFWTPRSGCPEVISKMEPTAAIAVIQEQAKNKPLLGVMGFI